MGGGNRTSVNQQKQTKKFRVLIRRHVNMMATVTIIVISVIRKIKNSNSSNNNY